MEQRIEELEGRKRALKSSEKGYEAYNEQEIERLKYLLDNDIKLEGQYDFNARKFLTSAVTILGQIFLVIGIAVLRLFGIW